MKKLSAILLFLISLFTLFLFASCKEAAEDNVNIVFWHYYHGVQQTALDNLIKEYNTTEGIDKGITVEAVSYGGVEDLSGAVLSAASGKNGGQTMPDLFSSYSDSAYNLAKMNKLADLNKYFTAEELDGYIDYYIEDGRFSGGELYVFPVAKATEILMLNKTGWNTFAEAVNSSPDFDDVSTDMLSYWEGILQASEIYYKWTDSKTAEPNDGKALFGMDYSANFFYAGAVQLGYEFFGEAGLNRDVLKKLWDFYYAPMVKGYYGAYGRFRSDDVKTGDILCFTGSTSSAAYFPLQVAGAEGDSYDIEAYTNGFPVFSSSDKAAILQGAGICVSKSDDTHEKAAAEFLKWFTEPERNLSFNIDAAGYFPVTDEAMEKLNHITEGEIPSDGKEKILNEVYKTSIKQIGEYRLYSAPATEASVKLRAEFDSLKSKAEEERNIIMEKANSGDEYEAAVADATGETAFEDWFGKISVN